MKTLKVKITENRTGGEVFSWHLKTKGGDGNWWGMEIRNANEMRKIAKVLTEKANELERGKNVSTPTSS